MSTHLWHVSVVDHEGNPVSDAEVALVDRAAAIEAGYPYVTVDANVPRVASGEHEAEEGDLGLEPGSFALVVHAPGKSSVLQALLIMEIDGHVRPALRFRDTLACVDSVSERIKVGDVVTFRSVFRVTLFPATEYVFIAGTRGPFVNFARDRPRALEKMGRLDLAKGKRDLGAVVTIFSCGHRGKCRMMRGKSGWIEIEAMPEAPKEIRAEYTPKTADAGTQKGDVGILSLYRYLHAIAERNPASVKEVGIFSHAAGHTPALWNTEDRTGNPTGERHPADFDGRGKDFLPVNMASKEPWNRMAESLSADARWFIWGCNADQHERNRIREANAHLARAPEARFSVITKGESHGVRFSVEERTTLNHIRRDTLDRMQEVLRSYPSAVARAIHRATFSAPPGVGASFGQEQNVAYMFCDTHGALAPVYKYLRREFPGLQFSEGVFEQGYLDYASAIPLPAPPFSPTASTDVYMFSTRNPPKPGHAPTRLLVDLEHALTQEGDSEGFLGNDYRLRVEARTLDGRPGHRYVLTSPTHATHSFFVTTVAEEPSIIDVIHFRQRTSEDPGDD